VAAAGVLAAAAGCGRQDPLAGFAAPRALRLAPDGRLLVTDLGTGRGDGKVVAVDLAAGQQQVLLERLPSTRRSGQQHADLAGPSGAAMAADGTVCAAIGDATRERAGFSTLRCSGGLVADLEAYEQARNPDGRELASNPYDVAWDGGDGWYVSDAAANAVLHADRAGRIRTVAVLTSMAPFGGRPAQGVPTGLARAADGTLYVALFGGSRPPAVPRWWSPCGQAGPRPAATHRGRPGRRPDRGDRRPGGAGRARLWRHAGRPRPGPDPPGRPGGRPGHGGRHRAGPAGRHGPPPRRPLRRRRDRPAPPAAAHPP
jgi:hypothetical protein